MNWEAIGKLGTANFAIAVIGYILWEQTQALVVVGEALVELVKIYSGS